MSISDQSLDTQLGWCITTRDYLEDLGADIRHIARFYDTTIDNFASNRYVDEMLQELVVLRDEFNERAENAVRHIDDVHVTYINKQSDLVRAEMDKY